MGLATKATGYDNNDPANLVLIEHTDHMMLHGGRTMARLKGRPQKKKSAEEPTEALAPRNRRKAGGIGNGGGNF